MKLTPESIISAARAPHLHERISPPGAQFARDIAGAYGPLPKEYTDFLEVHGAWHFFRTIGKFSSDEWWFGIGWEPKIAMTGDDVWFACGYRFTLGYHYFKFDLKSGCFAPQVYGGKGAGLGIFANSFDEWFQQCVAWTYRRLPKKVWREEFGLPKP